MIARAITAAVAMAGALAAAGCGPGDSCLPGRSGCEDVYFCSQLRYTCDSAALEVGKARELGIDLTGAGGTGEDIVLRNSRVTVVIDAIESPRDLAPTGGTIIDFGARGGPDDLVQIYQLAGILPDDAFAYTDLEVVESAGYVAVIARGRLDERPEVEVATRYELRPCEPGVRVRSELLNGSAELHAWILSDAAHWGKRGVLPFAPVAGQGFSQPELELVELQDVWNEFPWVAARAAADDGAVYGVVPCNHDDVEGINDVEVSALGAPRAIVRPGEHVVYERFWLAGRGSDLGDAVAELFDARTMLHADPPATALAGRVVVGGAGFGGSLRRASVLVSAGGHPVAEVVPGEDGRFVAPVPAGQALSYEVLSFGRVVATGEVPAGTADLGNLELPAPATLTLAAVDGGGEPMYAIVALHPADAATRDDVTGTWHGRFDACAPWLGPPHGASPACNRVLLTPRGETLELPAGRYEAYATAGYDHTLARAAFEIAEGGSAELELSLVPVDVRPGPGWLAADLHVHGRQSFDSTIPDVDRVLSFVAAGLDVVVATDHDWVTSYEATALELGVGERLALVPGLETTPLIPFLDVPGEDLPQVVGHFNFWPLPADEDAPRGGAPYDERREPAELYDELRALMDADGIVMLNHPWADTQFGRDLGYLRAIGFDPREPIPPRPDGSGNGMLVRQPNPGGARNLDFDVMEVYNGADAAEWVRARPLWFSLLSQGKRLPGASNSDSHGLTDSQIGFARTLVDTGAALESFDVSAFNGALARGRAIGGTGITVVVTLGAPGGQRRGLGLEPYVPSPGDTVDIEVLAPPWVPVTEVRAITSGGERVLAGPSDIDAPADPFGAEGVARWQGSVTVTELWAEGDDDWLIVEAGLPLFEVRDLDDDGVPDTTDNDRDGDIDDDDIEEDEDSGPLEPPADPADEADLRFALTRVVPGAWPVGFTNPILVDWDGDGWDAPGLGGAR